MRKKYLMMHNAIKQASFNAWAHSRLLRDEAMRVTLCFGDAKARADLLVLKLAGATHSESKYGISVSRAIS